MDITPRPRMTRINERWTNQLWHGRWAHHRWQVTLFVAEGGFVEKIDTLCHVRVPGNEILYGSASIDVGPFDELREIVSATIIQASLDAGEQQVLPGL